MANCLQLGRAETTGKKGEYMIRNTDDRNESVTYTQQTVLNIFRLIIFKRKTARKHACNYIFRIACPFQTRSRSTI